MPFQIVNDELMLAVEGQLPPRAEWKCRETDFGTLEIMGWGGECLINVALVPMQDSRVTGIIVKVYVDSPIEFHTFDSRDNEGSERGPKWRAGQSIKARDWANAKLNELMSDPLAVEAV